MPSEVIKAAAEAEANSESKSPAAKIEHHNNMNLFRLGLAGAVLLSHSWELIDGDRHREILTRTFGNLSLGELAVFGFFLLSGYLIVQSWSRSPQLRPFFTKRMLRIYPGFIVASLISVFVVGPVGLKPATYFSEFKFATYFKTLPFVYAPTTPPVFLPWSYPVVNGPMRTIKFEFTCYILVAMFGTIGMFKRRWLWLGLAVVAVLISCNLNWLDHIHTFGLKLDDVRALACYFAVFSAGGCFYIFRDRIRYSGIAASVLAILFVASLFSHRLVLLGVSSAGAYVFFWLAFRRLRVLNPLKRIPDISYGVYLYGWPVQKLLLWYLPSLGPMGLFGLSSLGSAVCGLLSFELIEKPFLKLKPARHVATAAQLNDSPVAKISVQ